MRSGPVAVLRSVSRRAGRVASSVVRSLRSPGRPGRGPVPTLSPGAHRTRSRGVPVRRAGPARRPPVEVRGLASGRPGARRRHGRVGRRGCRRRDVGAVVSAPSRLARVRPGAGVGGGRRSFARPSGSRSRSANGRSAATGPPRRPGAPAGHPWGVRGPGTHRRPRPAGGRRVDHGGHGRRVRRGVARGGGPHGAPGDGRARRLGRRGGPILDPGLASGSVVARGTFPR